MLKNKKGAALLQVLLVTVVLAGMATMLLRASLSRTTTARQTRRTVSGQMLINACMAEVNAVWSAKTHDVFASDLEKCIILCSARNASTKVCTTPVRAYTCNPQTIDGITYTVTAEMNEGVKDADNRCKLTYTIAAKNSSGAAVDVEF